MSISYDKQALLKHWVAKGHIRKMRLDVYLGHFFTYEEAIAVVKAWTEKKYGGTTPETRFMSHIKAGYNDCWLWTASVKNPGGYPQFGKHAAHRWAYDHWNGGLPSGYIVRARCGHKLCVNPSHLELVRSNLNNLKTISSRR